MFFIKMELVCCQLEEPLTKPACWTLLEKRGCLKSLKRSSQSRPLTDFVRMSLFRMPEQPSLFLNLNNVCSCEHAGMGCSFKVAVNYCTFNGANGTPNFAGFDKKQNEYMALLASQDEVVQAVKKVVRCPPKKMAHHHLKNTWTGNSYFLPPTSNIALSDISLKYIIIHYY